MPKHTRLNEDAVIYQPRKEQSEKEKLRDMPIGKKLSYLWEYYKIHALVGLAAIAFLSYITYQIITPDIKEEFYAAVINNSIDTTVLDQYKSDFSEHLQLDPETQKVEINTNFYYNTSADYAMNMKQILATYVAAEQVDVIIAPKSEFESYAYYGFMAKLSDQLPTDVYSSLTDSFYMSSLEDDPEVNVYGIYLTDTNLFKNNAVNDDPYVLGIVGNYPHKENTIEFIRYLFKK